jgi:hypothetical protein
MRRLHPFEPRPELGGIELKGEASWRGGVLQVRFVLRSPGESLSWPALTLPPARLDGLWQSTCLEAFIAAEGEAPYWEVNLAPNGNWNVYALSGYRENLQPVGEMTSLPYSLRRSEGIVELQFQLDLNRCIPADERVEVSLTAVLEDPKQGLSYWAWKHSGDQPDFHLRGSFQLLPSER